MAEVIEGNFTSRVVRCLVDGGRSALAFIKEYPISIISVTIAFVFSLLAFDYVDCISETCWTLSIWDALFDGRLLEYSAVTFENLRGAPHAGDTGGFLPLFPWAIWNFPLWITHLTPGNYNIDNPVCIIWSKLFLILCLFLSSYFVKKLSFEITEDRVASEFGFILCFTAGAAIISIGYAGQNEIIYVTTFLASIYSFIKGHKFLSACLMIYSLASFPFLVVPLVFILLIKNYGIVKTAVIACGELLIGMILFGIGGSNSASSYGSITEYLNWFFFCTKIDSAEGSISLFAVIIFLILFYCIFKEKIDPMNASIVCIALCFMSMLVFSWMHFYRYFVCMPAIVLSTMVLFRVNKNTFKIGLILFTIINYASCIVACNNLDCWNYRYFLGFLSNYFSYDYVTNFLFVLFGDDMKYCVNLVLSLLFITCAIFTYVLIKKPTKYKDVIIKDKTIVTISSLCPLFLVVVYILVPVFV